MGFIRHGLYFSLYYYMRNSSNLIGLEQWYFSFEVPTCENYKPFVGSSIKTPINK